MSDKKEQVYFNISVLIIAKILGVILLFYFFILIRDILVILFVALILASALNPMVDWLQRRRVPRPLGMLSIYLVLAAVVTTVFYLLIPPIAAETRELSASFPQYHERILSGFDSLRAFSAEYGFTDDIEGGLKSLSLNLQAAAGGLFATVTGIFGGIVSFILVLVITFYMVAQEQGVKKIVWSIAPEKHQLYILRLIARMQKKIGLWLRGQLILSVIIFTLTYIGLSILGVKYALFLAMLAGLIEFVPYLGPIIAAIPAVFIALTQSPMLALFTAALYYVIQLTENNIILPKVMQNMTGLNPVISITVILIGFKLAGVLGAILAVPTATAVSVLVSDLVAGRRQEGKNN